MGADDTSRDDMGDPIKHCERCGREVYYGSRCPQPCAERNTSRDVLVERVGRVLDDEGAFCGECDNEPGGFYDECSQCRRFLSGYATAVVDAVVMPLVQERDRLAAELAVDVKHQRMEAEGRDCPVCTHVAHEGAYDELDAAIKRAEAAEREARQATNRAALSHKAALMAQADTKAAEAERDLLEAERDQALAELGRRK